MRTKHIILLASVAVMLTACGTKKAAVDATTSATKSSTTTKTETTTPKPATDGLAFVRKVYDNQLYQQNIVGKMNFTIQKGSKDITLPGSMHMRKDVVIRLQISAPLIGTELGRIEFTPDYVLVIDRIHKEFVKASYDDVDFLKNNGLTFYSLQALFWNQLLLPNKQKLSDSDLQNFTVGQATATTIPLSYTSGKISYLWQSNAQSGRIVETDVTYQGTAHGTSKLVCNYDDFRTVGVKSFPAKQTYTITTNATKTQKTVKAIIDMSEVTTDSDWETHTTVSPKYKQLSAKEVLGKLTGLVN